MTFTPVDLFGAMVAESLERNSGSSPFFQRDLNSLHVGEGEIVLGGTPEKALEQWAPQGRLPLLYLGGEAGGALAWSELLGENRLTAVGATCFDADQARRLRSSQRFLPLTDVGFSVALQTALSELGAEEFAVSLNLNLFSKDTHLNIPEGSFRGLQPGNFLACLDSTLSGFVSRYHIWGSFYQRSGPNDLAVALGAEVTREILLAWWRREE